MIFFFLADCFSSLEAQPYKLTLLRMLEAFISLTRKVSTALKKGIACRLKV